MSKIEFALSMIAVIAIMIGVRMAALSGGSMAYKLGQGVAFSLGLAAFGLVVSAVTWGVWRGLSGPEKIPDFKLLSVMLTAAVGGLVLIGF